MENYVADFMQIVRTVYGSALQTALLRGIKYQIPAHTTLNEKFGVEANTQPPTNPSLGYYAIGNGGHRMQAGADGIPYVSPIRHRASDAALYHHLPFVLRLEGNDLTAEERAKYGGRVKETHNGKNYVAYYWKRMDPKENKIIMQRTVVKDGVSVTTPFIPTSDNLNPVAPTLPPRESTTTNGEFLSVSSDIGIIFDEQDVKELINVAQVLYDNPLMAAISEIALCTGTDKSSTGTGDGGAPLTYKEAVGVQVATHVTVYHVVGYSNMGFDIRIELGATEPMMGEGALGVTREVLHDVDWVRE